MFRSTLLILAGALLAGCEDTGIHGDYTFGPSISGPSGSQVSGQTAYRDGRNAENQGAAHTAAAREVVTTTMTSQRPNPPRYPTGMRASDDLRATALVGPTGNAIKIANASDQPLRDVYVWIDGSYAARVAEIPPYGTVTVRRSDFTNPNGDALSDLKNIKQIQLQTRDNLYNLQGPVFDNR